MYWENTTFEIEWHSDCLLSYITKSRRTMRNAVYLFLLTFFISCNSVKRSENNLYSGNYDETIRLSIRKLQRTNNVKKRNQHITLLEKAYAKAVADDASRIDLLQKENDPENAKEIYDTYNALEYRQKLIRPLLPCLLYTSPSPRDQRGSRMPSSA